jgi:hypothetical protein
MDRRQPITPVLQAQGTHHCWAAVVAMMLGRQGDSRGLIHQVISEARGANVPMNGDSLDATAGPQGLAIAYSFQYLDLRPLRTQGTMPDGNYFANFLRSAPFGLFGNRPGYGLHALAVNRLHGDFASLGSTEAHGVDPASGQFSRPLISLVMPSQIAGAAMTAHCVIWR